MPGRPACSAAVKFSLATPSLLLFGQDRE